MTAVFRAALGSDFERLHPRLQERFGFSSADGIGCVGRGRMDRIWRGSPAVVPLLQLGTQRNILFPETGSDVPFTIENHAYVDDHGRETLTFVRTFELAGGRRRRFDAQMVHNSEPGPGRGRAERGGGARGSIVDYLGTHQHIAAHLDVHVDTEGGLHIRSGRMAFLEGIVGVRMPAALCADARVHERWDEAEGCFRIVVHVRNRAVGPVSATRDGSARPSWTPARRVPAAVRPYREEIRA